MLGYKISFNKFKKIEIISSIFSDHNAMELEINHENNEKHTRTWQLNSLLLNNKWVNNKIKEGIKRQLETNENEDKTIQNQWDTGKATLRGKSTALSQENKKTRPILKKTKTKTKTLK